MSSLLVRLSDSAGILYSATPDLPVLFGESFSDAQLGEWTGFYDWLRNPFGQIIGVRYWPFEHCKFLLTEPNLDPDIRVEGGGLLVFFGAEATFEPALSGDQDFEESRVLRGESGSFGLLLGCSNLSSAEQTELQRCLARPSPNSTNQKNRD
jgi:hypothetical protein